MGLFRSIKARSPALPTVALPIFALHLANPKGKVFKPNDTIQGHVNISTPTTISPQAIEVLFWGRSIVWWRDQGESSFLHYRDNARLCRVTLNLFTPPQQLHPGQTYSFPFQFRVPERTDSHRMGGYKDDKDATWTAQLHQLPPTFTWGNPPGWAESASITYGITARLVCPGIGVGKERNEPISATLPVLFQPLNANHNAPYSVIRHPKTFKLASSSLGERDPSSIAFRQKPSGRFSSKNPRLKCELCLEIPDLLTSGTNFSFRSTFNVARKTQNVVQPPNIAFRVLKLELHEFTFIRAASDKKAKTNARGTRRDGTSVHMYTGSYSGYEHHEFKEKKTKLQFLPQSQVTVLKEVPGTEQASRAEVWFTASVPGSTPPSFQSFAITRVYRVRAKVEVRIGKKKFRHQVESDVKSLGGSQ